MTPFLQHQPQAARLAAAWVQGFLANKGHGCVWHVLHCIRLEVTGWCGTGRKHFKSLVSVIHEELQWSQQLTTTAHGCWGTLCTYREVTHQTIPPRHANS